MDVASLGLTDAFEIDYEPKISKEDLLSKVENYDALVIRSRTKVDAAVIESARGMGMTPGQVLWQVELPLAAPVLLAGIRVATVLCIGVTTIAAAIGAGGLGVFIFRGVSMVNNQVILAGAIPAALLAVLADTALGVLQWRMAKQ